MAFPFNDSEGEWQQPERGFDRGIETGVDQFVVRKAVLSYGLGGGIGHAPFPSSPEVGIN